MSRQGPRPSAKPERLLLDQIAAGELDPHLVAIDEAVRARLDLLHTVNSQKALAMLSVGDRVRINRHASPATCTVSKASWPNSTATPQSSACTVRSDGSRAGRSGARRSC